MNNKDKNKIYSELMSKLKKSMSNEFYYEAIFVEYAILEDRTSSLLKHANRKYNNLTLNEKLSRIKSLSIFKDKYCLKHLTLDLIDRLYKWKNQRNKLIHDLIKSSYDNLDIKEAAEEGYELVKKFNGKTTLVNKYLDNINKDLVRK